jgi:hypothetical protein
MQRNLTTRIRRTRRLWLSLLALSALLITGCGPLGSDDDEDPTATADTISQPTTEPETPEQTTTASSSPGGDEQVVFAGDGTPDDGVTTPLIPAASDDGESAAATPDQPFTVIIATPVEDETVSDPLGTPQAGSEGEAAGSTEPSITGAAAGSDGTSGATPEPAGDEGTSEATPALDGEQPTSPDDGTPVDEGGLLVTEEATPTAVASTQSGELDELEPVSVTSCEPGNVPPFGGEQSAFITAQDVNFRTGPGADCDLIGEGPIGINIPVTLLSGPVVRDGDDEFTWVQVQIADTVGWVVADVLEPAP